MKENNSEAEINRIRLELYDETKDLTLEERAQRQRKITDDLAMQYGFTVRRSVGANKESKAI